MKSRRATIYLNGNHYSTIMRIVSEKRIQPERKPLTNRLWHIREDGHSPLLIRNFSE